MQSMTLGKDAVTSTNLGSSCMPRLLNRVFFVTVSVAAMMSMEGNSLGQASYRRDQALGFHRVRMGDFEITAL
jgi:hypothetical protein